MQWLMLQQEKPEDFVIATGVQYSVRDFIDAAVKHLGMDVEWRGDGLNEIGVLLNSSDGSERVIVRVDPKYYRPAEVETLLGDASKAREKLGWSAKISFQELVQEMVRVDLESAERDELVKHHGYRTMNYHE
jgi:GDPmannose 4,6-dehydratase